MTLNYNLYLNKIENAIRTSNNYALTKDECKKLFREEKRSDPDKDVDRMIKWLEDEKNTKIRYKQPEKVFTFISKFNLANKDALKKYLEDLTNEPLEESQDLTDEYKQIKADLEKELEGKGYMRKFTVTDKKSNKSKKVIMFGRNPNDPIEQMNLGEEFKEFKDVKPLIICKEKTAKNIDSSREPNMPVPKKKVKKSSSNKPQDTGSAINSITNK